MRLSNRYFAVLDILLILLSAFAAFAARFDTLSVSDYLTQHLYFFPLLLVIRLPLFYAFGLYRHLWRYASVNELMEIAEACFLGSVVAAVTLLTVLAPLGAISYFPRSIIFIEGIFTFLLVGGIRFSFRLSHDREPRGHRVISGIPSKETKERALVFGAGDAGALIVREMYSNPALGLEPVAFLDDDASKKGLRIHNVPVLGNRGALEQVVRAQNIHVAIIAMPSAPGHVVREIIEVCRKVDVPLKTIPGLYEILSGLVKVSAIREVQLEDLLRRESVRIDLKQVGRYLSGASVLVTGAGGSIGSELCRQIARFAPQRLVLFELAENNLYQIRRELKSRFPSLAVVPILGDIRELAKVDCVFAQQQPTVVFHAAAHKHVPLMEENVDEVVLNNILGTRNVLAVSAKCHVSRFVLISTDKAVNPRSVMGATKRVAELLVQDAARRNGRAFVAVRFGNVLGSSGSVVPLFKEQIAAGGPVTVTHPEIQRYFMTIPEAVSLIIQAAAFGKGGEIFVLDMGEPVRIRDLAEDLIRLSGFDPNRDIEIVYTGLRQGEKLSEELFTAREQPQKTGHPRIFAVQPDHCDGEKLIQSVQELEFLAQKRDMARIKTSLTEILPEYSTEAQPLLKDCSLGWTTPACDTT